MENSVDEKLKDFMKDIDAKFDKLCLKVAEISGERHPAASLSSSVPQADVNARQNEPTRSQEAPSPAPLFGATGRRQDIQGEFQALRDSLTRIQLPADLKLNDSRQGIRKNDQPVLNVITRCGKYNETLMKLLTTIDPDTNGGLSQVVIEQLFLIAYAQTKFLQDEFASLVVNNHFDSGTARLFRALQKNTSGLNQESLETLRSAAAISAAGRPTNVPRGQAPAYRGRGRGYQGHYNRQDRQDVFQSFAQRPFPRRPPPHRPAVDNSRDDD